MNTTEISKEALEAARLEFLDEACTRYHPNGYHVQQAINAATSELREQLLAAQRENEQLRQQVHDLCHDKHTQGPVTPEDFCDGCEKFQQQLFGRSPITELKTQLAKALDRLNANVA